MRGEKRSETDEGRGGLLGGKGTGGGGLGVGGHAVLPDS